MLCEREDAPAVLRAARSLEAVGEVERVGTADALRRAVLEAAPGELGVVIGPLSSGVSDVNLAAAVARDGNARRIALARWDVSGSLRSRAARAGVDDVVDLSDMGEGAGATSGARAWGRPTGETAPAPAPPPRDVPGEGPARRGAVVTLCSGRGGVGKTALVATAAACAARWGMRACALDLDLSCGNLFSCFGLPGGSDLARISGGVTDELAASLAVAAPAGACVAGPCERPESAELAMPRAGELVDALARSFDLVVIDTSATFTDAVAQAAQLADRLLVVSDGGPGTAATLARTGGLAVRLGVARTRIARLENRASPRSRADVALLGAEGDLGTARALRVFEGGPEVAELLAAGEAGELAASGSPFAESVATALAQLLAELGRLPSCEEAERAAEGAAGRRRRGIFSSRREAR